MPLVESPAAYSVAMPESEPSPSKLEAGWWNAFGDDDLTALVETSLGQNLSVAQALERIDRASFLLHQARALRMPQVDLTAQGERLRQRAWPKPTEEEPRTLDTDTLLSLLPFGAQDTKQSGGGSGGGASTGGGVGSGHTDRYASEFSGGLRFGWELDLWGRLRAEARARGEEFAAALDDHADLRLLLSGLIADAYYQAIEQRLQAALLAEQHQATANILELLELRFLQGAASAVDVLQQRGQLTAIEAEVPLVETRLRLLENRLDVLAGQAPDGLDRTAVVSAALPTETQLPRIGVPLDLLQDRPDLRALQRRVVAADYRIAAAMAERLPRITLDGSSIYGEDDGASTLTVLGAVGLVQPLLDWGARDAAVRDARARTREALLAFSEAYLLALEEVENALWQEARQRELIEALIRREAILERTVEETRMRYGLGVTDYLPVLTAVQDIQDVQREILRQRRILISLRIEIYRATGGVATPLPPAQAALLASQADVARVPPVLAAWIPTRSNRTESLPPADLRSAGTTPTEAMELE